MSMCKLHSEFYRQQAKLDALLTRRCHTITEGKNGEGATYIKTARGWLHIAHGVRNTAEGLRYVIYLFVTDLKEPWKVIAEPAGFLIAPRGWERVSDVSTRPLFKDLETARKTIAGRLPMYEDVASVSIDTVGKSINVVAQEIQDILEKEGVLCLRQK